MKRTAFYKVQWLFKELLLKNEQDQNPFHIAAKSGETDNDFLSWFPNSSGNLEMVEFLLQRDVDASTVWILANFSVIQTNVYKGVLDWQPFEDTLENTQWRKAKQMQPMWLCVFSGRRFKETFEDAQWRKAKQMQSMWLCLFSGKPFEYTFENAHWRKAKQVQTMWLCILSGKRFEDAFEDSQWRKAKQMHPMWLCIFLCKRFEETFENAQWRKIKQMQPMH